MVPVLNKPFIEYIIRYLSGHSIDETILAMGYRPDAIIDYFGNASHLGANLTYSVETTPLGTAGAVKNAEPHLGTDDTLIVMNGDVFTDIDITEMLAFHKKNKAKVTIALTPVDDPTQFGVVETDREGHVIRFVEKPKREEVTTNLINAGVYILDGAILKRIPQGRRSMFEYHVFPGLLADDEPVFGYATDCYWIDTGTPEKYLQLTHDLMHGKSHQVPFKPDDINIDERSFVGPQVGLTGPILVDRHCTIGKGVHLKGPVVIGPGCNIADGVIIENSVLWQRVNVGEQAKLKDCIVASDNHIENNTCVERAAINNIALTQKQS